MKTLKKLVTYIEGVKFDCEIYQSIDGNEYFFINNQPVDMKIIFKSQTIDGYLVVVEDDEGERMSWTCEEI